jgi:hypothetical protein
LETVVGWRPSKPVHNAGAAVCRELADGVHLLLDLMDEQRAELQRLEFDGRNAAAVELDLNRFYLAMIRGDHRYGPILVENVQELDRRSLWKTVEKLVQAPPGIPGNQVRSPNGLGKVHSAARSVLQRILKVNLHFVGPSVTAESW